MPRKTDVIIIGGGQAGLATSHCLSRSGVDHVVLERGEIAQRWRHERWTSLRLLTPNWMTRLPGWTYQGNDPHGYMHKDDVADFLSAYSTAFCAPVVTQTRVTSVRKIASGFHVRTTAGDWQAKAVVLATGACDRPNLPAFALQIPRPIAQVTLDCYKSPAQIADGGVLVVGASASGIQIAHELQTAGREVTLAVGAHSRIPRRYRGSDILFWLDQSGILNERRDPNVPLDRLLTQNSFQLIGAPDGASLDLGSFQAMGGHVTGRLTGASKSALYFGDTLTADIDAAQAQQARMLRRIDAYIKQHHLQVPAPQISPRITVPAPCPRLNLRQSGLKTIVWACGYRRDYSWLDIPVLSRTGEIRQRGGITPVPGLYTMGLPFMRRRNSTFIDGVAADAREITQHITQHLGAAAPQAA